MSFVVAEINIFKRATTIDGDRWCRRAEIARICRAFVLSSKGSKRAAMTGRCPKLPCSLRSLNKVLLVVCSCLVFIIKLLEQKGGQGYERPSERSHRYREAYPDRSICMLGSHGIDYTRMKEKAKNFFLENYRKTFMVMIVILCAMIFHNCLYIVSLLLPC